MKFSSISIPIIIFIVIFLTSAFFSQFDVDPLHDGIMFKAAYDITHGKTLFSQTYSHYGPVTPYLQALAMSLFGNYVLVMRLSTAFIYAGIGVLLWLTWSTFFSNSVGLISVCIWLFLAPYYTELFYAWPSVDGLFFVMLALFIFVRTIPQKINKIKEYQFPLKNIFFIGMISCFAFLSKQPFLLVPLFIGGYFILLWRLHLFTFKTVSKQIIYLSAGFLSIFLLFFLWLIATHGVRDYWLQVIREGYIEGRIIGNTFLKNVFPFFSQHFVWVLISLSAVYYFVFSLQQVIQRNKDIFQIRMFGVSLLCLASIAQIYPLLDQSHVYLAITPALGLFVYFVQQSCIRIFREIKIIDTLNLKEKTIIALLSFIVVVSVAFLANEVISDLHSGYQRLSQAYVRVSSPKALQGILLSPKEETFYFSVAATMRNYLRRHPDKHFVIDTSEPLYLTFTDQSINVLPIFANYSGYTSGLYPFEAALSDYIQKEKPLVMIDKENVKRLNGYYLLKSWNHDGEMVFLMAPKD